MAMDMNNPQPGKFLVRHASLNIYLGPAGHWVKRAEAALEFPHPLTAISTCLARGLKDVELIQRFDGERPDLCLRLDAVR
jgi:hypothetical protein